MNVKFYKYQGTGNDFVMIDNRGYGLSRLKNKVYEQLCHRRFGIGADGLILLQETDDYDFEMVYFNADGNESSMCGNGGRCIARFAYDLGIVKEQMHFLAIDGAHEANILSNGEVRLKMKDVDSISRIRNDYELNTGSPHYVIFENDVSNKNLLEIARNIRYSETYAQAGINVNVVEVKNADTLQCRTYERGVEDETFSCGTGVVAGALSYASRNETQQGKIIVETLGGKLAVEYHKSGNNYNNIYLTGAASFVFSGEVIVD